MTDEKGDGIEIDKVGNPILGIALDVIVEGVIVDREEMRDV